MNMTKKLLAIVNLQSISDIITNSSSEVFVVRNKGEFNGNIQTVINNVIEAAGLNVNDVLYFETAQQDGSVNGWNIKYRKGNLLIWSTEENSIPYWLQEFIQSLDYQRINRHHLG